MSEPIIKLKNVTFGYKEPILNNMNLEIYPKEFVGIVGPNGGGKTTLLKLLLGIHKPQSGKIIIFNKTPKEARTKIGYLSQYEDVDFDFPIKVENIVLMGRNQGRIINFYSKVDKKIVNDALDKLEISELKNRKLNELSGGEKQRVFLARALTTNPKILILDEPMANVDVKIRDEFFDLLKILSKKITILVVEHNIEVLSRYVNKIVCINKCIHEGLESHDLTKMDGTEVLKL